MLAVAVAACDGSPLAGGDTPFVYATSGTDRAVDLVQTPSGDLVVVGSTEGRPRPADGTLALPSVLRFGLDGELASAEVYRDVGYGDVESAAWSRDGLVVSLSAGPDGQGDRTVGVYRAGEDGRRTAALLERRDGFMPRDALVASSDGGVTAAITPTGAAGDQVYRFDASGDVVWSVRVVDTQDVRQLAPAPGGDVYAVGPGAEGWVIVRLDGETGAERWRRIRPDVDVQGITATSDGLAILESAWLDDRSREVRVATVSTAGQERGTLVADRIGAPPEGEDVTRTIDGEAIAALPGGGIALAITESGSGFVSPPRVTLVLLASDGSERSRARFGVEGRWSTAASIVPLADGRVAVAGSVGPERISGYGGDDFDIWVTLYGVNAASFNTRD